MANPFKQISARRLPPFPGGFSGCRRSFILDHCTAGLTAESVKAYLRLHPDVLEEFVADYVCPDQIESWLHRKAFNVMPSMESLAFYKGPTLQEKFAELDIINVQRQILAGVQAEEQNLPLLYNIGNAIGAAIKCGTFSMYAIRKTGIGERHLYIPAGYDDEYQLQLVGSTGLRTTVSAHVGHTNESVLVAELAMDERFPHGIGVDDSLISSVLCVPITLPSEDTLCVLEYGRMSGKPRFSSADLQITTLCTALVGISLHQNQVGIAKRKQAELNDFLLEVTRVMFDDMIAIDSLVKKIMVYAKDLVRATRCALFLVNQDKQELQSNLFDEGHDDQGKTIFSKKQIKFPMTKGIAGHVAVTAEIINIPDAYLDSRFNKEIDAETGFTTKSILCMPIICKNDVIGVVQLVNKAGDLAFTQADEAAFKTFAVYCALALYYSKMYGELKERTAQSNVAMEMMTYHACSLGEETSGLYKRYRKIELPVGFDSFYFYGAFSHREVLSELFISMITDLFGPGSFDIQRLCRFVMTVKRNYRDVPYHNYLHGWNVAHCMYCMLKRLRTSSLFTEVQMKALVIGCLCHDVDHRGYNNAFFKQFNEPLATLYPNSVMEQHHYAMSVGILQREGHDIFADLSPEDYKTCLTWIKSAILATDLAQYFPVQATLAQKVMAGTIELSNEDHLRDVVSLMMTGCDLSAACKPWSVQQSTVDKIYEEFYTQGDIEKRMGAQPIPMMDRNNKENIPQDQVSFIRYVCRPCYQTLADILPETADLLHGCMDNMGQWQRVVEGKATEVWEPDKSRVQ